MARLWLATLVVASLVQAGWGAPPKASPPAKPISDRATVDQQVLPFVKDKPWLGIVVGITRPEGQQVYGYGNVVLAGKARSPGADTLFEIGSITKTFTGTLLADLVQAGIVRLDDPAQKYLPGSLKLPRRDGRDITLLHLATHSSSLPRMPLAIGLLALAAGESDNPFAALKPHDLQKQLAGMRLVRPIGCQFAYSNLGVGLLGESLVGAARASSYEELLKTRVTGPLGMADTVITLSPEQRRQFPPCHRASGKETKAWTFASLEGCGALHSTAHDLLIYVDAYLGRRKTPLVPAFALAMQSWRDRNEPDGYVGLCWMRQTIGAQKYTYLWHNGGTFGSHSFLGFVPEKGVGVVVLCNAENSIDAIGSKVLETLIADKK